MIFVSVEATWDPAGRNKNPNVARCGHSEWRMTLFLAIQEINHLNCVSLEESMFASIPKTNPFIFARYWRLILVFSLLTALLGVPTVKVNAATASFEASADTYMNSSSGKGNLNYGGSTTIQANPYNPTGGGKQYKGILMRWDLSSLPSGTVITSASITFHVTDASVYAYNLYAMRRSWVEGTNDGAPGTGASWNYYGAGTGSWAIEGVQDTNYDRYNINLWDAAVDDFSATGDVTIPLNTAGLAVVQGWIDGSVTNYGMTMQNYSEGRGNVWIAASSENTSYAGPTLNLTYVDPPVITTTGTLTVFSTKPGISSAAQTYMVKGSFLKDGITISAPAGFELSIDGITYSSSLTLPQSGGSVPDTTIYVRLFNALEGTFGGNITHTSTKAAAVNVPVSGAVIANRAPVITEGEVKPVSMSEDGDPVAFALTLNATDPDAGETLTWSVQTAAANGLADVTGTGLSKVVSYTPDANYYGTDEFVVEVSDGSLSDTIVVAVSVEPVNDVPTVSDQSVTLDEDVAKVITLGAADIDGDTLTWSVTDPAHGTLSGTAPDLTYTPDADFNGTDSFTFKVNDGTADSAPATVSLTIDAVNDVPVANAQSITTDEDVEKTIVLTGEDVEGASLTFAVVDEPAHGVLSGAAPNMTYTPYQNFNGSDSFTFKVNDGSVDSELATVDITVNAVNDTPVADAQSITTSEDVAKTIVLTGSDVETVDLVYSVVDEPLYGTLNGTAPNLTYTPDLDFYGSDHFTFKVNDGSVDSTIAEVSITVDAVNDAPVANPQTVSTDEDNGVAIELTGLDVESAVLTYAVVDEPLHGVLSGVAPNLTYTPYQNFNGADSFTFKVNDGSVDSELATVSVTVAAVNDTPVANSQDVATDEDTEKAIDLSGSDVESTELFYSVVDEPQHGTLSGTAPNLIYTPDVDFNGADSFTFKVNDGALDSVSATVTIHVNPVNDAPVASNLSTSVLEEGSVVISLTANDVDGQSLSWEIGAPSHGDLYGTAPDLTYVPEIGYTGEDQFTFKVSDGLADSNIATVRITINEKTPSDLVVTISDGLAEIEAGKTITYVLTVENIGANPVTGATVATTLPDGVEDISWVCTGSAGGTCTASGSGEITDTVNLPVAGQLTYTVTARVKSTKIGDMVASVTVSLPVVMRDINSSNNTASDTTKVQPIIPITSMKSFYIPVVIRP